MNDKTEELKRDMYYDIACLKGQKKHPILLARFESKLEEYLEALRQDHAALVKSLQSNVALYQDAYENQKTLTRNACVFDRERWDVLCQLRSDLKSAEHDREEGHDKLQEATAKLAQQAQTIIALHRVIKSQQNACARSQRGMDEAILIINRDKARFADERAQDLEAFDEVLVKSESRQKTIVSQRKHIDELQIALLSALKPAKKPSLWAFLTGKKHQAQPLPKKTD